MYVWFNYGIRMDSRDELGFLVLLLVIVVLLVLIKKYIQVKRRQFKREAQQREQHAQAHQQDDIYNISGRVQNQEQWPTHDAHLSIDHISVLNQMNKPVYDDAPPSYEEVMKTSIQVVGETSTPPYSPPQPPSQVVIVVPPTTRSQ
ncbi:uncharacterized protein LOC114328718 isoform X2 [Diabrotica virgifera virgifera]|uniref:Uncharacterized protein LOC114328718 isoform X2 n=1 Tax=Diabrotica virgifera virgifera TaxID=50390 RepID=A0A6P7FKH0_DIAVI|nr:uncharacterized protein LOC114328718 isoform X2 [Diabrotica virgifera virgifera]